MTLSLPPKLIGFGRRSSKRKDRMILSLPPKLMVFGGAQEKGKTG
jgi:hypothetical protein